LVPTSVTLIDLERRHSPYFAFFTEFDPILSAAYHPQLLAKTDPPCSMVSLRLLSYLSSLFLLLFSHRQHLLSLSQICCHSSVLTSIQLTPGYEASQSARYWRTVVRVVQKSIGNGTFGGAATEKPLNRLTQNLAWVITSGTPLSIPNGISIG